jgi:hypothetical protein
MVHDYAAPPMGAGMPAEIAKAIGEVMAQVKSLPKSETNDHGGYQFASIDAFLSFIGPLCSASGLIVLQDEDNIDLLDRAGKTWAKITYSFSLAHTSGAMWSRQIRRTVFQRIDGPQTTGGTQSYALKMFLRSLFQVPTGERDDPDYHAKEDMPAAAPPVRQEIPERAKPAKRTPPTKPAQASSEPEYTPIQIGTSGALYGRWTKGALDLLSGKSEQFRRDWLEMHAIELSEMRTYHPDYADRVESAAISPDLPDAAE